MTRNVAAAEAAGPKGSYERLVPQFEPVQLTGDAPQIAYAGAHLQRGSSRHTTGC